MSNPANSASSRRLMLARLGLAAGAGYVAPTLFGLSETRAQNLANVSRPSVPSRPSRVRGPRASRPSRPSR
ncbi:hypothetical protein ACLF3G_04045 [Falsiroseomonas sp. HC035]|uniref:hypothetical protein n=1 Tax=Falsiroseomonas sp. HC035 TaxID=3390999 RepID=UPI003D31CBE0